MSTTSATATTEGKVVLFTGDKGGCAPKGWCRPSIYQWQHICPAWIVTVQHHSWVNCQCAPTSAQANIQWLTYSMNKWSHLMWEEDSRSQPTCCFGNRALLAAGGRLDEEFPWMRSVCQGTATTPGTSSSGFVSPRFPLTLTLELSHLFWCRNMFHFDKLTAVTYKEAGFVIAVLKWLKTMNQLRKNPVA